MQSRYGREVRKKGKGRTIRKVRKARKQERRAR
jgi:hypothetical protein